VVPGARQRGDGEELGGLAARRGDGPDSALEAGHALLEGRRGGIRDTRVDRAVLLQREEIRGVRGVLEDEAGGLVDGDRPRPGGGIGTPSGVQRSSAEAKAPVAHGEQTTTAQSGVPGGGGPARDRARAREQRAGVARSSVSWSPTTLGGRASSTGWVSAWKGRRRAQSAREGFIPARARPARASR
jgi:hypothetical protein